MRVRIEGRMSEVTAKARNQGEDRRQDVRGDREGKISEMRTADRTSEVTAGGKMSG